MSSIERLLDEAVKAKAQIAELEEALQETVTALENEYHDGSYDTHYISGSCDSCAAVRNACKLLEKNNG